MKFFKNIVWFTVACFATISCQEPLESTFNELDEFENEKAKAKAADELKNGIILKDTVYTLTEDDYKNIDPTTDKDDIENFESFSSLSEAKNKIAALLSNKFPTFKNNSSGLISFNLFDGNPVEISNFVNAQFVELDTKNYPTGGGNAFLISEKPIDLISDILNTKTIPTEGKIVRVQYNQFTEEAKIGSTPIIEYNFQSSLEGWTPIDILGGTKNWRNRDDFIEMNGFDRPRAEQEDWLVSPEISLKDKSNIKFQITQSIGFGDDSLLKILVSKDYTGDVDTTTWTEVELKTKPVDDRDAAPTLSEEYDLSVFDNETIHIALKYNSTTTASTRWRINKITLNSIGLAGSKITTNQFFIADASGNWNVDKNAIFLSKADYDTMGEESGQPGNRDNFSNSIKPENYIPTLLKIKYPFAQQDDALFMIYKFFVGGDLKTINRGNQYSFNKGNWETSLSKLQFGLKKRIWIPDNTIKYTFSSSDYKEVVASLTGKDGFADAVSNLENFNNFNRTGGGNSWTDEMLLEAFNVVLKNNFAKAEVGQKYLITFSTFNSGRKDENKSVILDETNTYIFDEK